jgi:periplasmic divalent cation tolerance protein
VSPLPIEPARASGPMRLVLSAFPSEAAARRAIDRAIDQRLAACASEIPQTSTFVWKGKRETAREVLVVFKTGPKTVGALLQLLAALHPYEVPELVEIDVPRADDRYLSWLAGVVDPGSPGGAGPPRRPGAPRGRAARGPARTRARPRRRSTRS